MTKKFNSRLVEWVNDLGQYLLQDMKALEKRNFKDSDVLSDALSYIYLQKDFGQSDYKSAKLEFDQVINKLQKLPTKKCPFCNGEMVDNTDVIILKQYMKNFGFSSFSGAYRDQCNENVWLGNLNWSCYGCETLATDPPKDTAKVWLNIPEIRKKKIFASIVFKKFPEVEAMSLEGAAGRGWLLKFNETWYSNSKVKAELVKVWEL
ncbi:hypothetical protein F909_00954 [Acinetobacter sp. ANC 3929]|uniref:hypothetical protein n=1 Tax=Acinetobacter sp. ANC 3929 TaxID=1217707 RepID=UPI0002D13764|nr:hypothetical protein [Acinetobacter sp. ANC 3929]ENW82683.1 hypothetical protein F909_00954 [Acinetobacter sp. ANC 3929]